MNNLENIISKIKANSKLKENILLDETENKMKSLEKEFELKLAREKEILKNSFETKRILELERINSSMDLKAKKEILNSKGEIINFIINELKKELSNISDDELYSYIEKILEKRKLKEGEIIILPLKYSNLTNKFPSSIISDKLQNGFIISSLTIEENYSFDSLIKFRYEDVEKVIQEYFN